MDNLFELSGISFGYPHHGAVLKGVDFCVGAGERVAVAGANGAGKSTLFHLMVGLLKPDAGKVVAFGKERCAEMDFYEVRRRAGLVFQDPDDQLFCPTVAEDVAFGPLNLGQSPKEALAVVDETLERLRMSHLRDRVTHKLSGGEKRLVSLATVLAMKPDVLLLDEPTNALDEKIREHLIGLLQELPQAMVIISHDAHFRYKVASRQFRLDSGRLTALESHCPHAAKLSCQDGSNADIASRSGAT